MQELTELPSDTETLQDLISEKQFQANAITFNNPDALIRYESLQSEVTSLKAVLQNSKSSFEQIKRNVEWSKVCFFERNPKDASLENVDDNIETLYFKDQRRFCRQLPIHRVNPKKKQPFFTERRCIGQVSLQGEEVHGNNFQNYGLEIRSFKD